MAEYDARGRFRLEFFDLITPRLVEFEKRMAELGRGFQLAGEAIAGLAPGLRSLAFILAWPQSSDEWVETAWLILRRGKPRLSLRALRHAFRAHCKEINL